MRAISLDGVPVAPEPKRKKQRKKKRRASPRRVVVDALARAFSAAQRRPLQRVELAALASGYAPCNAYIPVPSLEWRCAGCGYTRGRHKPSALAV